MLSHFNEIVFMNIGIEMMLNIFKPTILRKIQIGNFQIVSFVWKFAANLIGMSVTLVIK